MQDTELPEKIEPTSLNFQTDLAAKLAELVPEALSDGKLDVAKLREMINGDAENSPEKFGLFWPGKRAAQALAQIPTTATLTPAPEESVDWENTKNVFIEGDNLEVLKALQNSYRRKIKMIYIDPPYNKDKDFVYPDRFTEGLQGYLDYTGQKNEVGENTESKPETSGRKHSNWLSMIYPRLQLAKSLLTEDGAIFISIDDDEAQNLLKICMEVFGEDNFVAQIPWRKRTAKSDVPFGVSQDYEWILVFARTSTFKSKTLGKGRKYYETPDLPGRSWRVHGMTKQTTASERPNSYFTMINPKNGKEYPANPNAVWRITKETFPVYYEKKRIVFPDDYGFLRISQPMLRYFEEDDIKKAGDDHGYVAVSTLLPEKVGMTKEGTAAIIELFGEKVFTFPKPVNLIAYLVSIATGPNDIVLDAFSGSGTTAHSVMQLNAEDDGARVHIQIQLPEPTFSIKNGMEVANLGGKVAYDLGFKAITDISKERIRRAGQKILQDYADKIAKRSTAFDTGFRVYKLARSNFVQWDENRAKDDIQQSVLDFAANKKPDAAPESLLTEIMLQARMPLSANIEKRDLQSGSWVYIVDGGNLIAYVASEQITEAQANEIADFAPAKLIVLDSAFNGNNALKINVANICKEKFIKEFKTI